jgi:hypothetical protein
MECEVECCEWDAIWVEHPLLNMHDKVRFVSFENLMKKILTLKRY